MENQNHCMSIKQAQLIVNAHKHNLLNSFCNNGYIYVKQHENNNNKNKSKIWRERERENSNSKTLFYKDCNLGSVKKPV